jgi:glutathione synthase/RimK-type ligase-like ATP-grasp enzyme
LKNKNEERDSVVYRVPVFIDKIPLIFIKYRSEAHRFRGNYHSVEIADPTDIFSKDELRKILKMARLTGIEYGECDVLRDRDGTLYVIDFNNHPGGPPFKMNPDQKKKTGKILADSLEELFRKKEGDMRMPG